MKGADVVVQEWLMQRAKNQFGDRCDILACGWVNAVVGLGEKVGLPAVPHSGETAELLFAVKCGGADLVLQRQGRQHNLLWTSGIVIADRELL